jgi:hypothetical protein
MQRRCSIDIGAIPDRITGSNTANNHGRAEILRGRVLDPPLLDQGRTPWPWATWLSQMVGDGIFDFIKAARVD